VLRPCPTLIPVAMNVDVRWRQPAPIEAIILWPAFLTPGVCLATDGAFFELLLQAPKAAGEIPRPTPTW
jgi:hypothetical protein